MKKAFSLFLSAVFIVLLFCGCHEQPKQQGRSFLVYTPSDSTTEQSDKPETIPGIEPVTTTAAEDSAALHWKAAYLAFLQDNFGAYLSFELIYIDNDSIPELYLSGNCEAVGDAVCAYKGGKVVMQHLRRTGGGLYVEQGSVLMNQNGNMGCIFSDAFTLAEDGFIRTFSASRIESYVEDLGNYEYLFHYDYSIGETPVSETEYNAAIDAAFPFAHAKRLGEHAVDYETIRQQILEY